MSSNQEQQTIEAFIRAAAYGYAHQANNMLYRLFDMGYLNLDECTFWVL